MFEDSQRLIFESIVKHWSVEGPVSFLQNGLISVKFKHEPGRIWFHSLLSIIELLDVFDENKNLR